MRGQEVGILQSDRLQHPLLVPPFKGLFHLHQHFTASIGLREEGNIERSQPMLRQDLRRVCRHVEDSLVGPLLQHLTTGCDAVALGHHDVQHDEVDSATGKTQHIKGFDTGVGLENPKAFLREDTVGDPA